MMHLRDAVMPPLMVIPDTMLTVGYDEGSIYVNAIYEGGKADFRTFEASWAIKPTVVQERAGVTLEAARSYLRALLEGTFDLAWFTNE